MPKQREVKILHKESGSEGYCLESAVDTWVENGWTVADDGDSDTDSKDETVTYVVRNGDNEEE